MSISACRTVILIFYLEKKPYDFAKFGVCFLTIYRRHVDSNTTMLCVNTVKIRTLCRIRFRSAFSSLQSVFSKIDAAACISSHTISRLYDTYKTTTTPLCIVSVETLHTLLVSSYDFSPLSHSTTVNVSVAPAVAAVSIGSALPSDCSFRIDSIVHSTSLSHHIVCCCGKFQRG